MNTVETTKKIMPPPDFDGAAFLRFMEVIQREKEIMRILGMMSAPIDTVMNYARMFESKRSAQNRCLAYLDMYNYGYLMGVRAERQKRRAKA